MRWVSPHALAFRCPACVWGTPPRRGDAEVALSALSALLALSAPVGPVTSELHGIACGRPTRASAGGALVPAARWALLRGVTSAQHPRTSRYPLRPTTISHRLTPEVSGWRHVLGNANSADIKRSEALLR